MFRTVQRILRCHQFLTWRPISTMEHHVYFAVFGFDGPIEQVTLLAGREPDDGWQAGDAISEVMPDAVRTDNRWIISSKLDATASHRDHFEKLLLQLEQLSDALPLLLSQYRCGIGVSQYFFMEDPDFYLPAELIQRFKALGLALSFDQLGIDHNQS